MIENFKLRVFRVVAETLSFRRAGEELHLTQPAITAQIKTIEESLGIALFDRIGRDIDLTPAGATLLRYVRQIETITNEALVALAPFGGQEEMEMTIGASHTIAVYLLPKLLPPLLNEWPKLRVHVRVGSTNEVLQALTTHQIAVGLIEAPAFRPDLKIELFAEDELALIVRPDHRWAKKAFLRAAELVQEPILLREVGSGMRRFVEEYLERNGVLRQQLHNSIDINSTEGILSAVEAGLGVALIPYMALDKARKAGSIKVVPLENGPVKRQLSIALLNGPEPRGPVGLLLDLVRESSPAKRKVPLAAIADEDPSREPVRGSSNAAKHKGAIS